MDYIIQVADYGSPMNKFITKKMIKYFLKDKEFKRWIKKNEIEFKKEALKNKKFYKQYISDVSVKMLPMVVGLMSYIFIKDKYDSIMREYVRLVKLSSKQRIPHLRKGRVMVPMRAGNKMSMDDPISDKVAENNNWIYGNSLGKNMFEKYLLRMKMEQLRDKEKEVKKNEEENKIMREKLKKGAKNARDIYDKLLKKDKEIIDKERVLIEKDKKLVSKHRKLKLKELDLVKKEKDLKQKENDLLKKEKDLINKYKKVTRPILEYKRFVFEFNAGNNDKNAQRLLFKAKRNGKSVYIKIALADVQIRNKRELMMAKKRTGNYIDPYIVGEYVVETMFYKYVSDNYSGKINMIDYITSSFIDYNPRQKPKIMVEGIDITDMDVGGNNRLIDALRLLDGGRYWGRQNRVYTVLVTGQNPDLESLSEHITSLKMLNQLTSDKQALIINNGLNFINLMKKLNIAHWDFHPGNIMIDRNNSDFYLFDLDRSQLNAKDLKIIPAFSIDYYIKNNNDYYNDKIFGNLFKYGVSHDINRFLVEFNQELYGGLTYDIRIVKKMFGYNGSQFRKFLELLNKKIPDWSAGRKRWDDLYLKVTPLILRRLQDARYMLGGKKRKSLKKKIKKSKK